MEVNREDLANKLGLSINDINYYLDIIDKASKLSYQDLEEIRKVQMVAREVKVHVDVASIAKVYRDRDSEQSLYISKLKRYIQSLGIKYKDQEVYDIGCNIKSISSEPPSEVKNSSQSKREDYYEKIRAGKAKPALKSEIKTEDLIKLREAGLSYEDIAYESGLSKSAVIYRLKKKGGN